SSHPSLQLVLLIHPAPSRSPLFPYTTLFRSQRQVHPVQQDSITDTGAEPPSGQHRFAHFTSRPANAESTTRLMPTHSEASRAQRSEEHTSELQSRENLVCRLLLEKKKRQSRN